ncbi:MAG: hypothetical protein RLZZ630_1854, partial [Bacteroidota bacterium]
MGDAEPVNLVAQMLDDLQRLPFLIEI